MGEVEKTLERMGRIELVDLASTFLPKIWDEDEESDDEEDDECDEYKSGMSGRIKE